MINARRITLLIAVIALAAAGWSGWWGFGASSKRAAVEDWLADRVADGWVAEADVSVAGYPNRFDMTVADLTLADPPAGWAWSAPVFRTYMLAYQPQRIIAEWPGEHVLSTPGARLTASAETLRASAAFLPTPALEIERAVLEAEALELAGDAAAPWTAGLAQGQLALRRSEEERGRDNAYDVSLQAGGLRPPEALAQLFGAAAEEGLPETLQTLDLDATVAFAEPLDRRALEQSDLRLQVLWLRGAEAAWGPLRLQGSGRLDIDPEGVPEGRIDVEAREWRALLAAARAGGALSPEIAAALEAGLGLIAAISSSDGALSAPLRFSGGGMFLGPIPLGPAPRF